ncbi:hypothetical protein VTK73DRAFT_702 [Phialemonium thermophilum]|uniref:Protein kinase domain-containing protein n=1 Tax=Phialemonium thermophilum TaxID=223376 RepID=A0ABR3VUG1_9PEZI
MSSAALQNQPTSLAALNPSSLAPASPSNRHYPSSHSSPTREAYHAQPPQSSSGTSLPSSSSRRPSRDHHHHSGSNPSGGSAHSAGHDSPVSPPFVLTQPVLASEAAYYEQLNRRSTTSDRHADRRRNMPTTVPPRTSSNQHHATTTSAASGARRAVYENERQSHSPRRARPDANGNFDDAGSAAAPAASQQSSRSSRRAAAAAQQQQQQQNQNVQEAQQRASSSRDSRAQPPSASVSLPTRSAQHQPQHGASQSSRSPSREASEIINSILISPPEIDIEREKERLAMAQPHHVPDPLEEDDDAAAPPPSVPTAASNGEESRRGTRSRHDHSKRDKQTKFGEYILGNTIGEGEFGKVKLGWKQEGGVQVAIKLIKKDQLGSNPTRMAKIMREVAILKQLTHPNIVRLHKMEESERHYGIILEYASGGELFDYILNHRYLKDNAARRLFAQLVSGVGYLHKQGIVHRDLKLENLLLDRNRNIIITDFGFANTFDPNEELTEEEEMNLTDREFVKRMGLDKVKPNGTRKGDLMQTSCGSPCYAAPELVVSDSLYTGRKVDVWSCGVILYAMLAGYLPFDDDPANPEGDNINLLYKYIVSTPLTFPEYVTPHARDLLRRILVPNPRKRADLFEVARHSWLSDYAHVVEFITSSTTTPSEIQNTTVPAEDEDDTPGLVRSSSVRESSKKAAVSPPLGGLTSKQGTIDAELEAAYIRQQKDAKRRTVQVEYVAPTTQTQRGEPSVGQQQPSGGGGGGRTRVRPENQGPVEVAQVSPLSTTAHDKPLPRDPPVSKDAYSRGAAPPSGSRRPPSSHRQNAPTRPTRDDTQGAALDGGYLATGARPPTRGSMTSTGSRGMRAGRRASYGQPLAPEVADTNVHGRIEQPSRGGGGYDASEQMHQEQDYGRPSVSNLPPPRTARASGFSTGGGGEGGGEVKGHKRSNTVGEITGKIFGRSGSIFGRRNQKRSDQQQQAGDRSRRYPPVSMNNAMIPGGGGDEPRPSIDSKRSRRSFTVGLGSRKRSGSISGSQSSQQEKAAANRRFSLLPGFSLKAIGIGKDYGPPPPPDDSQNDLPMQEQPYAATAAGPQFDQAEQPVNANTLDRMYAQLQAPVPDYQTAPQQRFATPQQQQQYGYVAADPNAVPTTTGSQTSIDYLRRQMGSAPQSQTQYAQQQQQQQQQQSYDGGRRIVSSAGGRQHRGVLQKNRRFVDAWDTDESSRPHDHSGSSGPARKVMDFFRRRGKARGGEDR